MKLSALIRKKQSGGIATAIPATFATLQGGKGVTVARIATVAVASPTKAKAVPLLPEVPRQAFAAPDALLGHLHSCPRPAANDPTLADWKTLDRAYLAHHVQCPQCIAAGRGYGQRCGTGLALWREYDACPVPARKSSRPAAMPADLADLLQAAMLACDFWNDGFEARDAMRQHCMTVPAHHRRAMADHFRELYGERSHD
jgi:hypothetical protein